MPTVVGIIDCITEWAEKEICSKVKLKLPPKNDKASNSSGYDYKLITPSAFSLFFPGQDKLPPSVLSDMPSLCVRLIEGSDDMTASEGKITVEFAFSTWATGTHGKDILIPDENNHFHMRQWRGKDAERYFKRDDEGWRDCWNWVDVALRVIESSATINGIEIDRTSPVTFGQYKEQEGIPDFYPFWFAWISFSVKRRLMRNIEEYNDFL